MTMNRKIFLITLLATQFSTGMASDHLPGEAAARAISSASGKSIMVGDDMSPEDEGLISRIGDEASLSGLALIGEELGELPEGLIRNFAFEYLGAKSRILRGQTGDRIESSERKRALLSSVFPLRILVQDAFVSEDDLGRGFLNTVFLSGPFLIKTKKSHNNLAHPRFREALDEFSLNGIRSAQEAYETSHTSELPHNILARNYSFLGFYLPGYNPVEGVYQDPKGGFLVTLGVLRSLLDGSFVNDLKTLSARIRSKNSPGAKALAPVDNTLLTTAEGIDRLVELLASSPLLKHVEYVMPNFENLCALCERYLDEEGIRGVAINPYRVHKDGKTEVHVEDVDISKVEQSLGLLLRLITGIPFSKMHQSNFGKFMGHDVDVMHSMQIAGEDVARMEARHREFEEAYTKIMTTPVFLEKGRLLFLETEGLSTLRQRVADIDMVLESLVSLYLFDQKTILKELPTLRDARGGHEADEGLVVAPETLSSLRDYELSSARPDVLDILDDLALNERKLRVALGGGSVK